LRSCLIFGRRRSPAFYSRDNHDPSVRLPLSELQGSHTSALVAGLERATLGPRPDIVAGRCSHRLAAVAARPADGRDQLGASHFAHDAALPPSPSCMCGKPLPVPLSDRSAPGASLIALLQYLADCGSDRLLIRLRQCRDRRSELVPGHVRAQPNRACLEDASLALQQPLPIYAVLFDELDDLVMLEPQRRLDLFVGKIARR
jgi:hypothetical protein